ncbi:MAG TPA: hypothetical protein PKE69_14440 [Pyrinomonadaceae bacterium]|nr:hypothetical protein [Pyrinomonadaceae bacterium]
MEDAIITKFIIALIVIVIIISLILTYFKFKIGIAEVERLTSEEKWDEWFLMN